MDLFRSKSLGRFQSLFVRIPAVQLSSVRIQQSSSKVSPNMNQQQWHVPAEYTRPLPNPQESGGATRTSQNARSSLPCLSTKWRSAKMQDQWKIAQLAIQVPSQFLLSPIYTLSKHHTSSHRSCLSKRSCESASHDTNRCSASIEHSKLSATLVGRLSDNWSFNT